MTILILRGDEVKQFLEAHGDQDTPELWVCRPICGCINSGLYSSHDTPCRKCNRFQHPAISPQIGDAGERAISKSISKMMHERFDASKRIDDLEDEIDELQCSVHKYDKLIKVSENYLSALKSQSPGKVRLSFDDGLEAIE